MPLNEKGWVIIGRSSSQLTLGKLGRTPEENVVIRVTLGKLPSFKTTEEFVRLVKAAEVKNINPERLRIIKHEVLTYSNKGTDCTKSHLVIEDYGAAMRVGKTGIMVQEVLRHTCAHPKNRGIGVNVSYSHRYYPEQRNPRFVEKATSVFDSVEFADP